MANYGSWSAAVCNETHWSTQLNSTWRRVVDTFRAWTTVTYQWTQWPSWLSL